MTKEQLLMDIGLETETFHAHVKRLAQSQAPLHPLDVDYLREKIRFIYDRLLELEALAKTSKKPEPSVSPVRQPEPPAPIPETPAAPFEEPLPDEPPKQAEEQLPLFEAKEEKQEIVQEPTEQFRQEKQEKKESVTDEMQRQKPEPKPQPQQKKEEQIKTTLDLFSDLPSESLSDKIVTHDEPSVAEKLQKSQIKDLREAIGINEKFQLLNELFNGDMSKYNKAIDELNTFVNLDGAKTYLFELHVENQWADDNPALALLNELLERKFA